MLIYYIIDTINDFELCDIVIEYLLYIQPSIIHGKSSKNIYPARSSINETLSIL